MLQITPAQYPCVWRHSPRSGSRIQYLATRKVTGESLDCNAVNFVLSAALLSWTPTSAASSATRWELHQCCSITLPRASVHAVGTTPRFIFQLPINRTPYYLVNDSTSLTSFIISIFFLNQKLSVTYLDASSTQLQVNTGFFEHTALAFHWDSGLFLQGSAQSFIVWVPGLQSPSLPACSAYRSQLV